MIGLTVVLDNIVDWLFNKLKIHYWIFMIDRELELIEFIDAIIPKPTITLA